MRPWSVIGLLFFAVFGAACHRPAVEAQRATPQQSSELAAIDSLLWTQPDSALTRLILCYDTVSDRHYANLLLAELLYKNYYEQTNRTELLKAVAHYDSLSCPFLAARAHYINGVGYYERDSVVLACEEYLKAVEIMEEHFAEKELVKQKAQFMALTYTHLCGLFSDQYLHEQAIYFGKQSLSYYNRYQAKPRYIAWMLDKIGSHFEMMGKSDSADYYYQKGLNILPDTNNLTYRDIETNRAFLSYKTGECPWNSLNRLQKLLEQAESEKEYYSRCLSIGGVYYHEFLYDSAWFYLKKVFDESTSINSKKQAAEWLAVICKSQGKKSEASEYSDYLAPFATQEENKSNIKSQLAEFYNNHKQRETELRHQKMNRRQAKCTAVIIMGLLVVMLLYVVLYRTNKRKKQRLVVQIKDEQYAHKIKQKALSGRLKRSNEALRIQKERANDQKKEAEHQRKQATWGALDDFMKEEACQIIMALLADKVIKREAKRGDYPELQLNDTQLRALSHAAEKHFNGFEKTLTDLYPKINRNGINQCLLYLLNLEDVQIAALLSCDYTTVRRRSLKLKEAFNTEKEPRQFIRELVLR